MNRCRNLSMRIALICITLIPSVVRAADVLDYLPDDALGFIRLNDLGETDARVQKLAQTLRAPIPAPLTFLQIVTGLGKGINRDGDALLAFLPVEDPTQAPAPLLLIPVSDYAQFVDPIEGDVSGEICRVSISGEDVLVAHDNDYAVLMNVEDRQRMESLLPLDGQPSPVLKPIAEWAGKNSIVGMLMPAAVDLAIGMGRDGVRAQQQQFEEDFDDGELQEMIDQMKQSLQMTDQILRICGAEIDAIAIGVELDEGGNLRIGKRVLLEQEGNLAALPNVVPSDTSPLAGLADNPYVAAGGGPIPEQWSKSLTDFSAQIMRQYPTIYQLEGLQEEDWAKARESWSKAVAGIKNMSMVFYAGESGDPLYSNVFGILEVDDSDNYLKSYRDSVVAWNELFDASGGDLKFQYTIHPAQIADHQGFRFEADVMAMMGPNDKTGVMKSIMELMFGEGGMIRSYTVAIDQNRVVVGLAPEDRMEAFVKRVVAGETGLADSSHTAATAEMLDPQAPWKVLASPRGAVSWFSRLMTAVGGMFGPGGGMPQIPEFADAPPIGFSARLAGSQFEGDMVWPAETVQALADFIRDAQEGGIRRKAGG